MRSSFSRLLAPICLLVLTASTATGQECVVPPTPLPIDAAQPDGLPILLRLRGTGLHNWLEDLDGHPVLRVDDAYVFATLDPDGHLQPTPLLVGRADPTRAGIPRGIVPTAPPAGPDLALPEAKAGSSGRGGLGAQPSGGKLSSLSGVGTVDNLVILLRFSDHGPGGQNRTLPSDTDVWKIMNAVGGDPVLAPTGSVRDHYLETSYGQLTIDSTIVFWVDVPSSETWYANGNSGLTTRTWNLITDGLNLADPSVDFSQFDKDGDGWIDAITFLHSGYGAEWGGTDAYGTYYKDRMWSHKWSIPTWTSAEGVKVSEYNISPGLWGTSGSSPGRIGVVAHELGHFFGLPDLYDTDGSAEGIGNWCLMAGGSWGFDGSQRYPSHLCAWSKVKMGWLMPERLLPGAYTVPRVEDNPTIYMIDSGYPPGEYLLIENREPYGFDSVIPQGGLAIWHIDETKGTFGSNNPNTDEGHPWQGGWPSNGRHYRVALLQADGSFNLERDHNRGDSGDPFHASGVSSITGATTPGTDAYQEGTIIANGNQITGIGSAGTNVAMTYGSPLAPTITTGSLSNGSPGVAYSETLTSTGGSSPKTWSEYIESPWYDEQGLGSSSYSATGSAQGWRADEGIWKLNLPFDFPYYETVYDAVYVSSNGFIEFAPTEAEPYNSAYTLRASRRIAPLWYDVRTDQSGQDIYVDTGTPGQVKIRWRGETYSGGYDVRFAVVLFEDGRIRFDYGSGNSGFSPTVGISRGEGGAYVLPSGYDGATNLGNADSLMLTLNGSEIPDGLSLSSSGVLSGTPTTSGTYNPWFRVTDDDYRYDAVLLPIEIGADCNDNGIDDSIDISSGTSLDCNTNGIPDECELAGNDCNANGVPDECDTDCNSNGTPDDCEVITDCNSNSVPDECELAGNDCNINGVPDECDTDCNSNGTPDDCEETGCPALQY